MAHVLPNDSAPHSLLVGAVDFLRGASIVAESQNIPAHSFGVLCAHAVELALKSYLLFSGVPENKLKTTPGHNLRNAWDLAVQSGLALSTQHPDWLVKLDAVHNAPFLGRYPRVNTGIVLPAASRLVTEIQSLIDSVKSITTISVAAV